MALDTPVPNVILQRAEKKDYQDVAAMLRAGHSLPHGLAAARVFFGAAFQPAESLKALTYFKDGDLARLSRDDRHALIAASAAVGDLPRVARRSRRLAIPLEGRRVVAETATGTRLRRP